MVLSDRILGGTVKWRILHKLDKDVWSVILQLNSGLWHVMFSASVCVKSVIYVNNLLYVGITLSLIYWNKMIMNSWRKTCFIFSLGKLVL